ncbi:ribonuclease E inhibitor RraB [Sinorhizobium medicae]|uniref:ribonuclease E inhibitor RraB n=2 Tax=Sinorhizobium medicae TaxID=110321 RepID=UPI001AAE7622|nr:ribonuclease E inhibitor RraB [Sinorhizobium medicae]MBO1959895.1 ribonuclease E inhibitor RraB [Sinorhizobium medicae]WQO61641.1 ribonuclease E inhibitor RraB [Sinorhizobium medicae]
MLQGVLFGVVMATVLDPIRVDEARLKAERTADADVLSSLHRNGDCASAVRFIDLRFVGSTLGVSELSARSADLGFTVTQSVQMTDGEQAIDLSVQSDTLPSTIDRLTVNALGIETRFNLRYDGWGTVATKC